MHIHPSSPNSESPLLLEEESAAAIKIQAGFRGYRVRKQLIPKNQIHRRSNSAGNRCCSNTNNTNNLITGNNHRNGSRMSGPNDNSTVAQGGAAVLAGALPTAANVNGNHHHPVAGAENHSLEDRCATKIQAGVRGFLVRKKQKMATDAATKIQANFRGFKARKEVQKLRQN